MIVYSGVSNLSIFIYLGRFLCKLFLLRGDPTTCSSIAVAMTSSQPKKPVRPGESLKLFCPDLRIYSAYVTGLDLREINSARS